MTAVAGLCPNGCGETLELVDGQVACSATACPQADSAHRLLIMTGPYHLVDLTDEGIMIAHGSGCDTSSCDLREQLLESSVVNQVRGRFLAIEIDGRWELREVPGA